VSDDVVQLATDVAEDVAEPVPLEELLPAPAEPFQEVLEAGQVGPGRVSRSPAALEEPAKRLADVALSSASRSGSDWLPSQRR